MKKLGIVLIGLLFLAPSVSFAQSVDAQTTYSPQYVALLQQLLSLLEQELSLLLASQNISSTNTTSANTADTSVVANQKTNPVTIGSVSVNSSTNDPSTPVADFSAQQQATFLTDRTPVTYVFDSILVKGNMDIDPQTLKVSCDSNSGIPTQVTVKGNALTLDTSTTESWQKDMEYTGNPGEFTLDLSAENNFLEQSSNMKMGNGRSATFEITLPGKTIGVDAATCVVAYTGNDEIVNTVRLNPLNPQG